MNEDPLFFGVEGPIMNGNCKIVGSTSGSSVY